MEPVTHATYADAMKRRTNLLLNKEAWKQKSLHRAEQEDRRLLEIIRRYYAQQSTT